MKLDGTLKHEIIITQSQMLKGSIVIIATSVILIIIKKLVHGSN